ncbi:MAG: hypothetical protein ABGZ17_15735 [Planctomycetaceae bacterium]
MPGFALEIGAESLVDGDHTGLWRQLISGGGIQWWWDWDRSAGIE